MVIIIDFKCTSNLLKLSSSFCFLVRWGKGSCCPTSSLQKSYFLFFLFLSVILHNHLIINFTEFFVLSFLRLCIILSLHVFFWLHGKLQVLPTPQSDCLTIINWDLPTLLGNFSGICMFNASKIYSIFSKFFVEATIYLLISSVFFLSSLNISQVIEV